MIKPRILIISTQIEPGGQYLAFGALYLYTYLHHYLRDTIDLRIADENCDDIMHVISVFRPTVIGISFTSGCYNKALRYAEAIKVMLPSSLLIAGGPHFSAMPTRTLLQSCFDLGIVGEAERPLLTLVRQYLEKGELDLNACKTIPGLAYRHGADIVVNQNTDQILNLDEIPFLETDAINMTHYLRPRTLIRGFPPKRSFPLLTSRGCPYNCFFCASAVISCRKCRFHTATNVLDQIAVLIDRYDIEALYFHDDLFIGDKKRLSSICTGLVEKGLNRRLIWSCNVRAETIMSLDDSLLDLMKDAGCVQCDFGFESGNSRVLKMLKGRTADVETNQMALEKVRRHEMRVFGYFMAGNWTETRQEILDTYDFIKNNFSRLNAFGAGAAVPLPGTQFWQACVSAKTINEDQFDFDLLIRGENNVKSFSNVVGDRELQDLLSLINALAYDKVSIRDKILWFLAVSWRQPIYVLKRIVSYARLRLHASGVNIMNRARTRQ